MVGQKHCTKSISTNSALEKCHDFMCGAVLYVSLALFLQVYMHAGLQEPTERIGRPSGTT